MNRFANGVFTPYAGGVFLTDRSQNIASSQENGRYLAGNRSASNLIANPLTTCLLFLHGSLVLWDAPERPAR